MVMQEDVARNFARGFDADDCGTASNFAARDAPDDSGFEAVLVSYGWAVVFGRRADGSVVEFEGWRGYSQSTSSQMGKARRAIREEGIDIERSGKQPELSGNPLNWRVSQSGAEPL